MGDLGSHAGQSGQAMPIEKGRCWRFKGRRESAGVASYSKEIAACVIYHKKAMV